MAHCDSPDAVVRALPSSQNGTRFEDNLRAVVDTTDGAFVMSGLTSGSYAGAANGEADFVAIKIDADKNILWTWQVQVDLLGTVPPPNAAEKIG